MPTIDKSKVYVVAGVDKSNRTYYYCNGSGAWDQCTNILESANIYKTLPGAEKAKDKFSSGRYAKDEYYAMKNIRVLTLEEAEKQKDCSFRVISRNGHFYIEWIDEKHYSEEKEIPEYDGESILNHIRSLIK